jgi:hypothetical protein
MIKKTHPFPDIISMNAPSHPKQTNKQQTSKQTDKQQTKKGEVRMFVRLLNTQSVFLQIFLFRNILASDSVFEVATITGVCFSNVEK